MQTRRPRLEMLEQRTLLAYDLGYALALGGGNWDHGLAVAVDSAGNAVVAGRYEGTVDFDPGPGITSLTSATNMDVFVAKYSSSGSLVWAKGFGTGVSADLATANDGSIFVAYSSGSAHRVVKLNASGGTVWERTVSGNGWIEGQGIAVGPDGGVYTAGRFNKTIDFDPGPGVFNLTEATYPVGMDGFITKLTSQGNFAWARQIASAGDDSATDIAVDASGNIYATGYFFNTVDFDPGAGTAYLTSSGYEDAFVWKLDAAGNYLWAGRLGGGPSEQGQAIAADNSGNIYVAGHFWGDGDYDPGSGTINLSSSGDSDIFVCKINTGGNADWARRLGGPATDRVADMAIDSAGNVCLSGHFQGTADFDPGQAVSSLTSAGNSDAFVARLSPGGVFQTAAAMGGSYQEEDVQLALDGTGNAYLVTSFFDTADFNPTPAVQNLVSHGGWDAALVKLTEVAGNTDIRLTRATADGQATLSLTYEIAYGSVSPFSIGLYRSLDSTYAPTDEQLSLLSITDPADLAVGVHTKTFTIGGGAGQAALPGAGAAETDTDYYILAVADPANAVAEADADPVAEDNTTVFTGVYHPAGGMIYVQGTPNEDIVKVVPGSVRLLFGAYSLTYAGTDATGLRFRGHEGNDLLNFVFGAGFGTPGQFRVFYDGGPGGNRATVRGSSGKETAEVALGATTFTGSNLDVRISNAARVALYAQGGGDTATLQDSPWDDSLLSNPTYSALSGRSFNHYVVGFAEVTTWATYGSDKVTIQDSPGNDTFQAGPTYAQMSGLGYLNLSYRFDSVAAYANAGNDTAKLFDSAGNDTLKASPGYAQLFGAGFSNLAKNFESVYAYGSSGSDTAYLYDSAGNDVLKAMPVYSTLSGPGYYLYARQFDYVHAYAGDGSDVAYLYDSAGRDALQTTDTYASLRGSGFFYKANAFDKVIASGAAGGVDTATLGDTAGNDYLQASGDSVRLYKNPGVLRLFQDLVGFEQVTATRSAGLDVKNTAASTVSVVAEGGWCTELSLSAPSILPDRRLAITAGEPLGSAADLTVRFTDGRYTVEMPILEVAGNSATVVVPPYLQPTTGVLSPGQVDVALVRAGEAFAATVARLEILDVLASSLPAGSVTLGYLRGALREAIAQQDAIRGTIFDTQANNDALAAAENRLDWLTGQIQNVINHPTQTFNLGTIGAKNVTINAAALGQMDRLLETMLSGEAVLGTSPVASPLAGPPLAGSGTRVLAAGELAELLAGEHQPSDANWDAYHSVPRTSSDSADFELWDDLSLYEMGVGGSLVGIGLGGAGYSIAAGAGLMAAVGLAAPVVAGGLVLMAGGILVQIDLYHPEQIDQFLDRVGELKDSAARSLTGFVDATQGAVHDMALEAQGFFNSLATTPTTPTQDVRFRVVGAASTYEDPAGGYVEVEVWLSGQPSDVVGVSFGVDDSSEGRIVSGSQLVFNSTNWRFPQLVVVAGVDDTYADGDKPYALTGSVSSGDPDYQGETIRVGLVNVDDEPELTISIDNTTVAEGPKGSTAQAIFFVTLSAVSEEPVSFQYHTQDGSATAGVDYQAVGWTTKTIPAGSLGTTVTVPVIGNDTDDDPDARTFYVSIVPISDITAEHPQGTATIQDDDVAGFLVSPSGGLVTTESGGQASFTVALTSEPRSPVTVSLSSSDATEGTVQPASLSFDATNWRTARTVTITGINDTLTDGDITYAVRASSSSGDAKYNRASAFEVGAVNRDNDGVGRFDGAYTGSYSGTATIPGYGSFPVNGSVACSVSNGVITVTAPEAGTGTVNASGAASFGAAGGAVGNATFSGTFVVQANGSVYASGTWNSNLDGGGTASGTWNCTRPPQAAPAASPAPSQTQSVDYLYQLLGLESADAESADARRAKTDELDASDIAMLEIV